MLESSTSFEIAASSNFYLHFVGIHFVENYLSLFSQESA